MAHSDLMMTQRARNSCQSSTKVMCHKRLEVNIQEASALDFLIREKKLIDHQLHPSMLLIQVQVNLLVGFKVLALVLIKALVDFLQSMKASQKPLFKLDSTTENAPQLL